MSKKTAISESYRHFSVAEGNQHIASEYAIKKVQELLEYFHLRNVLEVGLGIGSMAETLLNLNPDLNYAGTEANEFCLQSLPKNLEGNYERLMIFKELQEIHIDFKFDLVIIDGKDPNLQKIQELLSSNGIIVIEGDRMPQQQLIEELLPRHRSVHSISLSRNKSYSPFSTKEWQGGLKVIFTEPTRKQYVWWLKEKLFTKIKYRVPGRFLGNG